MKIILSPVASNKTNKVSIDGYVVTVDNTEYDLSVIPQGGQAEATIGSPFIGLVKRDSVTILYEYESSKAQANQSRDLSDYTFDILGGEVPCPIIWKDITSEVNK